MLSSRELLVTSCSLRVFDYVMRRPTFLRALHTAPGNSETCSILLSSYLSAHVVS